MQILKDNIRENILISAKKEFKANGYEKASMRDIAKKANISVGNLYRYYINKEEIFNTIIENPYKQITKFIINNKAFALLDREGDYSEFEKGFKLLANLFYKYKDEFIIIIYGSSGTKYGKAKEKFINLVEEKFLSSLVLTIGKENITQDKYFLCHIISVSIVEGLITIINKLEDPNKVKDMVQKLIKFIFKDFYERFDN